MRRCGRHSRDPRKGHTAHCDGGGSSSGQCFRTGYCARHCSRSAADNCRSDAPCTRPRLLFGEGQLEAWKAARRVYGPVLEEEG